MPVTETSEKKPPVVYVIDPDRQLTTRLMTLFERTGYKAVNYSSAEEFLQAEQQPARYGCVVSEMKLPGVDGLGLLTKLREMDCRLPLIILTGDSDVSHAVNALQNKVSDYLVKPVIERELIKRIKVALRRSKEVQGLARFG
jgi:FixJ family two-component response regulator